MKRFIPAKPLGHSGIHRLIVVEQFMEGSSEFRFYIGTLDENIKHTCIDGYYGTGKSAFDIGEGFAFKSRNRGRIFHFDK